MSEYQRWVFRFTSGGGVITYDLIPPEEEEQYPLGISEGEDGEYQGVVYALGLYSAMETVFEQSNLFLEEREKKKAEAPEFYVSTYCNFAHQMKDGKPIDHECRIIPPKALQAERDGDIEGAIQLMQNSPVRMMRRGVKSA